MPTPLEKYQHDLKRADFIHDPAQALAVNHLQRLYDDLLQTNKPPILLKKLKHLVGLERQKRLMGFYFWGGVGRGKTYLVDCFYDCLPFEHKLRIHFHRFMQRIHTDLKQLHQVENPLAIVADKLAEQTRILCFDEFHVADITDAMLLAGLLRALFEREVILITTSNQHPDNLYQGGLQRQQFLPAIALLKNYTNVINLDSGIDYRLQFLAHAEIYHTPLDSAAAAMLAKNFAHVSTNDGTQNEVLEIEGRPIQTVRCSDGVGWFDFTALCAGPRGAADYIEIARLFQTVLLANIPIMTERDDDLAKRFITLIDELYDRNVKLIITAAAQPDKLYQGSRLAELFNRTTSRLNEMRSHDYLAKPHLP